MPTPSIKTPPRASGRPVRSGLEPRGTALIPFKQWCYEEAARSNLTPAGVKDRFYSKNWNWYPNIALKRINQRVVYVLVKV